MTHSWPLVSAGFRPDPLVGAGCVLDPIVPIPLIGFLGLVLFVLTVCVYYRVGSRLKPWQNALLTAYRLLAVGGVLFLLLQPSRLEQIPPPPVQPVTLVAVDTSRSMKQTDVDKVSRLEAARRMLMDAGLVPRDGRVNDPKVRLFEFNAEAKPVSGSLLDLSPHGASTRFHRSVQTLLSSLGGTDEARAILLLSDGHDFELVNPAQTGFAARSRRVPIYAVALGKQGKVRDAAIHITQYEPYCYVKQKARLSASLRLVGSEFEDVTLQLLRQNQVVQSQRLNTGEQEQVPVQFEVTEPVVGQYEYEIRVLPLPGEVELNNNSAITYLNVIDQQIRVLLLEGSPYWDTTFLQRSLVRNDKVSLDSIIQYAPHKLRYIRKEARPEELRVPSTLAQFNAYDIIILGRSIDQILSRAQFNLLDEFVKNRGGAVIFSRGKAFEGELAQNDLDPVLWGEPVNQKLRLQVGREGQSVAPLRLLTDPGAHLENLPELIAGRQMTDKKPLTATLAAAQGAETGVVTPALLHRRYGQGQLLSVGVTGLWRWAFNAKVEGVNTLFDRFWDQTLLWLMASQDALPAKQFSFRTSTANLLLGEKVYFRLSIRNPPPNLPSIPLVLYQDDKAAGATGFRGVPGEEAYRLTADFLPERVGRYRAVATFPDKTQQESRFIVYDENLEETEVATDALYLKRLCEHSGGRLLKPDELPKLADTLREERVEATPKTRLSSLWDQAWIFYLLGAGYALDWYLRRRWGLC